MANVTAAAAGTGFTPEQEKILSKVLWRIVPFLLLCYIIAYLDRVNVGIASLTMNGDLGLSPSGWRCRRSPGRDRRRCSRATKTARSATALSRGSSPARA